MNLSEFNFENARIMISFPMNGKTDDECRSDYRSHITKIMNAAGDHKIRIINTYFGENPENKEVALHTAVNYLARSIKAMSHCTAVYFAPGWENARGCTIEHDIAEQYGITILED